MFSWKKTFTAAALFISINACGTQPKSSNHPVAVNTPTAPLSDAPSVEIPSAFVQVNETAGETAVACAFSINGKLYEGKSQAECDKLKKDLDISVIVPPLPVPRPAPAASVPTQSNVAFAFNVNGKLYEGKSQAECDKLKKDLGIITTIPTIPAPSPAPSASTTAGNVACAFNINGKLYEGKSQIECDKLKKDLGLSL